MGRKEDKKGKKDMIGVFFKNHWPVLVLLCAIAALTAGCADDQAQMKADISELQNQTYTLQTQVNSMSTNIQASQKTLSSKSATELHTIRSSQAGVLDQLSSMQSDLNNLRGSVDEQKHQNQQFFSDQSSETAGLEKKIAQQQTALDSLGSRITKLETALQAQAAQVKAAQAAQAAQAAKEQRQAQEAAQTPQTVYDKAYASYQSGKYDDARQGFEKFLKKFPDDPLAGNSQFWIAESYFKQKNYDQAILAYEKVVKHYPKSIKVPNALLQQGISFLKTNDKKVAAALFRQVIEKYPKSHQAKTAKALLKKVKRSRRG